MLKDQWIGYLAAGIAHEINTPTQYLGNNARFLKRAFVRLNQLLEAYQDLESAAAESDFTTDALNTICQVQESTNMQLWRGDIVPAIEQIILGAENVASIVDSMKLIAPCNHNEKLAVCLAETIDRIVTVTRHEWKQAAEVKTDFDLEIASVWCDPGELCHAMLTQLLNIVQELSAKPSEQRRAIAISTRQGDEWAEVRIEIIGCDTEESCDRQTALPCFSNSRRSEPSKVKKPIANCQPSRQQQRAPKSLQDNWTEQDNCFILRLPLAPRKTASQRSG